MRRLLVVLLVLILPIGGCSDRNPLAPRFDSEVAALIVPVSSVGEISAGGYHTCALKTDGAVVCWGRNFVGQATPPLGLTAVQLSTGWNHSCAVKPDGTVICWGDNSEGQRDVPPGLVATQVSAGALHTCAVRPDGTVVCWGVTVPVDNKGQATPPPGLTSVADVQAGLDHTCVLKVDGSVVRWGTNFNNQLNIPPGLGAVQLSGRWLHICLRHASTKSAPLASRVQRPRVDEHLIADRALQDPAGPDLEALRRRAVTPVALEGLVGFVGHHPAGKREKGCEDAEQGWNQGSRDHGGLPDVVG
jgi:hypothetical protein